MAAAGCSEKIARASLGDHIQNSTAKHVQFLWERLLKLQQMQNAQDTEVCSTEVRYGSLNGGSFKSDKILYNSIYIQLKFEILFS